MFTGKEILFQLLSNPESGLISNENTLSFLKSIYHYLCSQDKKTTRESTYYISIDEILHY